MQRPLTSSWRHDVPYCYTNERLAEPAYTRPPFNNMLFTILGWIIRLLTPVWLVQLISWMQITKAGSLLNIKSCTVASEKPNFLKNRLKIARTTALYFTINTVYNNKKKIYHWLFELDL